MSSDGLDDVIDEAVRGIMGVEAPGGLRVRVMGRIAGRESRPRVTWPRLAFTGLAAASLALMMFVIGKQPRVPVTPYAASASAGNPFAPAPNDPVRTAAAAPPAPAPTSLPVPVTPLHRAGRRLQIRGVAVAALAEPDSATTHPGTDSGKATIAPLDIVRPIEVPALRTDDIEVTGIVIAPLELEPVRVDPLFSTPR